MNTYEFEQLQPTCLADLNSQQQEEMAADLARYGIAIDNNILSRAKAGEDDQDKTNAVEKLVSDIREKTGIKIDHTVVGVHVNALVYGQFARPALERRNRIDTSDNVSTAYGIRTHDFLIENQMS